VSIQRVAAIGSIVVVLIAVAAGLMWIGSPAEQRLLRLDERRVQDLRQLAVGVSNRWVQRQVLPAAAAELVDGRWLSRLPADPSSDAPYEYRVTGPQRFELCAVFDRASRPREAGDFWYHDAGRHCFEFDVDEGAPIF
jgi:hypothetical protein